MDFVQRGSYHNSVSIHYNTYIPSINRTAMNSNETQGIVEFTRGEIQCKIMPDHWAMP